MPRRKIDHAFLARVREEVKNHAVWLFSDARFHRFALKAFDVIGQTPGQAAAKVGRGDGLKEKRDRVWSDVWYQAIDIMEAWTNAKG